MSKHNRRQTNLDIFIHRSDEFLLTASVCSCVRVTVSHQVFSSSHYVVLVTRSDKLALDWTPMTPDR